MAIATLPHCGAVLLVEAYEPDDRPLLDQVRAGPGCPAPGGPPGGFTAGGYRELIAAARNEGVAAGWG